MRPLHQSKFPHLVRLKKLFKTTLLTLLASLLVAGTALAREIYSFSLVSSNTPADAAVVLGTTVYRDRPSPVFQERINHAIDLYRQGTVQSIIFTGGLAGNDRLAESEAAREYALAQGIPAEHIFIETGSYNTCLNLLGARRIIQENGMDQVLLVSDPLHMRRAMWLAEQIGMKALASPTPTSRYQSFNHKAGFLMREVYSYGTYLLNINKCL